MDYANVVYFAVNCSSVQCLMKGKAVPSPHHFFLDVLQQSHILLLKYGVEVVLECCSLGTAHATGFFSACRRQVVSSL